MQQVESPTTAAVSPIQATVDVLARYFRKLPGRHGQSPEPAPYGEAVFSALITLVSLVAVFHIHNNSFHNLLDIELLVGSFGASAVLVYHATESPLSQPWNVIAGHIVSGLSGVTVAHLIPRSMTWVAGPTAVALAVAAMSITNSVHPPGGATALLAIIGSDRLRALGFWYVLSPIASGVVLMVVCAVLLNNLHPGRHYPTYWTNRLRPRSDAPHCSA